MKTLAALGLVGIILAAAATVAVWASIAEAPWEESPAAAFTEEEVLDLTERAIAEQGRFPPRTDIVKCKDAEYRPQNRMWVVTCDFDGGVKTATFTFDDQTGRLGD